MSSVRSPVALNRSGGGAGALAARLMALRQARGLTLDALGQATAPSFSDTCCIALAGSAMKLPPH